MNCPYCNKELKPIIGACEDTEYYCQNCDCMTGDENLWNQLTKYKQALDIAIESLNDIANLDDGSTVYNSEQFLRTRAYAKSALEQITEINDTKAV